MIYVRGIIKDIKFDKVSYPQKYILHILKDKEHIDVYGKGDCPFLVNEMITLKVSLKVVNNKLYYNLEDSVSPEFVMESDIKYNIVNPGIFSVRDWRLFQHSSNQALQIMLSNKNSTLTNIEETYKSLTSDFIKWNQELIK